MSRRFEDVLERHIGKTYGTLTVLDQCDRNNYGRLLWRCVCSCGTEVTGTSEVITIDNAGCMECKKERGAKRLKARTRLIGKKFNMLLVEAFSHADVYGAAHWTCLCDCGERRNIRGVDITSGATHSCGCYAPGRKYRRVNHGLSDHKLYAVWAAMKDRCYNPKHPAYDRYGGRGIGVVTFWKLDFMNFYSWAMSNGYQEGLTIERVNNNQHYSPNNCEWVTQEVQVQNTCRTKMDAEKVKAIRKDTRPHSVIAKEYGVAESSISRIIARLTWKNIPD